MTYTYRPRGVCSQYMEIETEDNILKSFRVLGGCDGNLQGIARLVEGMDIDEAYAKIVSPYKGALEMWYQKHVGLWVDFMLIFLTAWVIVFPSSELMFKVFKDLPKRD